MKINEVAVSESWSDILKAASSIGKGIASTAGITYSNNGVKNAPGSTGYAKELQKKFNQLVLPALQNSQDPRELKANLDKFLYNSLGANYTSSQRLNAVGPNDIFQYINTAVQSEARYSALGEVPGTQQNQRRQPNQPPAQAMPMGTTPPQQQPPQAQHPTINAEFKLINTNPITMRYRNREFSLDEKDQWHPLGSNKLINPDLAALLTKQLGSL
jgi:hypothetical protein